MEKALENMDEVRQSIRQKTAMPLLWVGIVSIVMLFASMTSAVVVSKSTDAWVSFDIPLTFGFSTLIIVLSSLSYIWAFRKAKQNEANSLKTGVLVTLILGLIFAISQFIAWGDLVDQGIFFAGPTSSVSGSYLYTLSGLHLCHLVGGIISLIVVYLKASRGVYNSENLLGLQLSTTYWHFLGGLWVYLYLFLIFIT